MGIHKNTQTRHLCYWWIPLCLSPLGGDGVRLELSKERKYLEVFAWNEAYATKERITCPQAFTHSCYAHRQNKKPISPHPTWHAGHRLDGQRLLPKSWPFIIYATHRMGSCCSFAIFLHKESDEKEDEPMRHVGIRGRVLNTSSTYWASPLFSH